MVLRTRAQCASSFTRDYPLSRSPPLSLSFSLFLSHVYQSLKTTRLGSWSGCIVVGPLVRTASRVSLSSGPTIVLELTSPIPCLSRALRFSVPLSPVGRTSSYSGQLHLLPYPSITVPLTHSPSHARAVEKETNYRNLSSRLGRAHIAGPLLFP